MKRPPKAAVSQAKTQDQSPRPPFRPAGRSTGLQPTKVGFYFLGLALLIGVAAINTGNNGLFLVTALMLASLAGAHLLGSLNVRGLAFSASQHGEVFAGRPFHLGLRLSSRGHFLPRQQLAVRLDAPGLEGARKRPRSPAAFLARLAPGEEQDLRLEAIARRRGRYRLREVRVSSLFPVGFFDKGRRFAVDLEWLVFPEIFPRGEHRPAVLSGQGAEPAARPGQGYELLGLRPYHPGDDPRGIHWKQSARQGQLISQQRQHEELRRLEIVFDNAVGELDEAGRQSFERLVSEAATAALDFLDQGSEVALRTRDVRLPFGTGLRHRLRLLEILALVESRPLQKTPLGQDEEKGAAGVSRLQLGLAPGVPETAGVAAQGAAA